MTDQKRIILAGAGPGLGLSVARRFGREGYHVGLIARRQEHLDTLAAELGTEGIDAVGVHGDVGQRASLHAAVDALIADGLPDVLVYNAVAFPFARPSKVDSDELMNGLSASVGGLVDAVQRVLQPMRDRGRGTILVTGGGTATNAWPDAVGLGVAKAAQRNFTQALHHEAVEDGVLAATITIYGTIQTHTPFDPALIAEEYWRVHNLPRAEWAWEYEYRGQHA
jgi:NADP-dependent 3-hydroxy acid dehydrogenase YdfG